MWRKSAIDPRARSWAPVLQLGGIEPQTNLKMPKAWTIPPELVLGGPGVESPAFQKSRGPVQWLSDRVGRMIGGGFAPREWITSFDENSRAMFWNSTCDRTFGSPDWRFTRSYVPSGFN